jgi:DNA-binding SARP family transcriptional activator
MIELRTLGATGLHGPDLRTVNMILGQPKLLALLVYLAVAAPGGYSRRDTLLGLFWPDQDEAHARNALSQALHRLRRALGSRTIRRRGAGEVGLDASRVWCDAVAFDTALEEGDRERALELYRGDLLDGFHLSGVVELERWLEVERSRRRKQATDAAASLAEERAAAGDTGAAIGWADRAASLAPYDEGVLRRLITLLDRAGDRAQALAVYDRFVARLAEELDVAPSPETQAMIDAVRSRTEPLNEAPVPATPGPVIARSASVETRAPPEVGESHGPRPRQPRLPWRRADGRRLRIAVVVGITTVASGIAFPMLRRDDRPTMADPAYTILADVGGNADAETRRAVKGLLRAGLEQSSVLMPVSEEEVRIGLARMLRPDTLPLDAEAARELAYRGSVRTIAVPSLDRLGASFALTVRVLAAEDGSLIATQRETSETEDGLIPAADRAVRSLHRKLGARRAELENAKPLVVATTPSFEAFRKFYDAEIAYWSVDYAWAVDGVQQALALDSTFVAAWRLKATMWDNVGRRDSLHVALGHVERHLHRVSERERLPALGQIASAHGDWPRAFEIYDRLVREYPSPTAWHLRAFALSQMGRRDEAAESYRQALAQARFGPTRLTLSNLVFVLTRLDRAAEARSVLDSIVVQNPASLQLHRLGIMVALDEWDEAESLLAKVGEGEGEWWAPLGPVLSAGLAARRGEIARAAERIDRVAAAVEGSDIWWHEVAAAELLLALVSGRPWPRPPIFGTEGLVDGQAWHGIWAAVNGDTVTAREIAVAVRDSFPTRFRGAAPEFIEAVIATRGSRWGEVGDLLGRVAAEGETGRRYHGAWVTPLPIRWLVADAYERAGQLDQAAAAFERVLATDLTPDYLTMRGIAYPFARQRLVLLYARMGRLDDATRHWEIFRDTFTDPDPEFRYLIDDARAALEQAGQSASGATGI